MEFNLVHKQKDSSTTVYAFEETFKLKFIIKLSLNFN